MTTTWINLTDLRNWHRSHPTGIQRILYEVCKEAIKNENIRYFYFTNLPRSKFVELNKGQVQQMIMPLPAEDPIEELISEIPLNSYSQLHRLVARFIPEKILKIVPLPILKLAAWLARMPIRLAKKLKALYVVIIKKIFKYAKTSSPFSSNDTICLLGASWSVSNLMEEIGKQRSTKQLKVITLICDLIPLIQPHLFDEKLREVFSTFSSQALTVSNKILAISENTKKDVETVSKSLSINPPPIKVVRLGENVPEINNTHQQTKPSFSKPYILCVGTLEVRKNHILIYQAYNYLLEKYGSLDQIPEMIIVGGKGWFSDDIMHQIRHDTKVGDKLHIISNCSDAKLSALYENCLFTVYPSVYEGWGLPIAESLKYGKFCLASNTSSMPEIAGDLLEYFSPYNSSQFAELIQEYSLNSEKLKAREERISREFKLTRWQDSAEGILAECVR